jgi:Helix-turn-helix domain/Cupin domain
MSGAAALQTTPPPKRPGAVLRRVRGRIGLTLAEVSRRTGISVSMLSKVENGRLSLSYERLIQISEGLEINVAQLFEVAEAIAPDAPPIGRRSICRAGDPGAPHPAADLLRKRLSPRVIDLRAGSMDEVPALQRLSGDVYAYVVEGEAELHTELYAPLRLGAGDSIYFDGASGHAWICAGLGACRVLTVTSGDEA